MSTRTEHPAALDAGRETFERMRAHGSPAAAFAAKFAGSGLTEASAAGAAVRLSDGRSLVDFGSYAVTLLGHRAPAVVDAVWQQLQVLPTSTRILANDVMPRFMSDLCEALGAPSLQRVWLGCNGSDAVEAALKLARLATQKPRVIALEGAYHGKSMGALAVTHNVRYRAGLEGLLGGATHVRPKIDEFAAELDQGDVAAFIFEPIQGEGGVQPVPVGFLRAACEMARAYGALVIADEVQTGLHRCGPFSLSLEWGLLPDAVVFGKVLGGGVMPLSAAVCGDEIFEPLKRDSYLHTLAFSGHPLSCAAGRASLTVLRDLAPRAPVLEAAIASALVELVAEFPDVVREVRGRGLAWGVECVSNAAAGHVMAELTANGLVHSPCLGRPEVLRLLPPLVVSDVELAVAANALRAGLLAAREALDGGLPPTASAPRVTTDEAGVRWVRPEASRAEHGVGEGDR